MREGKGEREGRREGRGKGKGRGRGEGSEDSSCDTLRASVLYNVVGKRETKLMKKGAVRGRER